MPSRHRSLNSYSLAWRAFWVLPCVGTFCNSLLKVQQFLCNRKSLFQGQRKDVPSTLFPESVLVSLWWSLTLDTVETASRSFQAFMRYSYEAFAVGTWMKSGSSCLRFLSRGCLVDFCIWATGAAGLVSISAVSHELCSGRQPFQHLYICKDSFLNATGER